MASSPDWIRRFIPRLLLWLPIAYGVWLLLTPIYNSFLVEAGQNLVRLTESSSITRVDGHDGHYAILTHESGELSGKRLYSIRVTDIHFNLVMLVALFMAVPGVPAKKRWENLGYALLIAALFHLTDLLFWIKFVYATQLGSWSAANYGTFGQNFWGLGKHLLDLPVKLGLPLLLWGYFYLGQFLGSPQSSGSARAVAASSKR